MAGEFIIGIIIYLLITSGLYLVAKNTDHPLPLGAFIPVVNLYMIISIAGYGIGLFVLFFILGGLISFNILFLILYLVFYSFIIFSFGSRALGNIMVTILSIFLPFIGFPVMGFLMRKKAIQEKSTKIVVCKGCKKKIGLKKAVKKFNCPGCGAENII